MFSFCADVDVRCYIVYYILYIILLYIIHILYIILLYIILLYIIHIRILYIILLYILYIIHILLYYILYSPFPSVLLFLSSPSQCSVLFPLPLLFSYSPISSFPLPSPPVYPLIQSIRVGIRISLFIYSSDLSSVPFSSSSHSFLPSQDNSTPHKLTEWMVEVCRFY